MNPSPPSALTTRAVAITGNLNVSFPTEIKFTDLTTLRASRNLAERLKQPLLVKLRINDTESRSVLLKQEEELIGKCSLQVPLNLRDGSILSVEVQEMHQLLLDQTLAQLNLSLENLWSAHEPSARDAHSKKYQVHLPDPKRQIWLHIATVVPQASSDDPYGPLWQTSREVSDDLPKTTALEDATLRLQEFKSALDRLGWARDPLHKMMKIAESVAELHPIASAVVTVVSVVYINFKAEGEHREDVLSLAERMAQTISSLPTVEKITAFSELKDTIKLFPELLDETIAFIQDWLNSRITTFFSASENKDRIDKLKARYDTFKDEFDRGVDNAINLKQLHELQELEARLGGIKGVNPRADQCMEGTRINIVSNVESKIDDPEGKNVVWISGAPGSGKSAVSLTTKSRLHALGRLVTYFRFDRNEASVTTPRALWSRVAFDLATRYPSVLKHNLSLLRENKVDFISTTDLFKTLVEEPLSKVSNAQLDHPITIVIDALDECGGHEGRSSADRKALLQTLKCWPQLPKYLKILVTSREESDISRVLSSISVSIEIPSGNFLTQNPDDEASKHTANDIRKFLEVRFGDIREHFPSLAKSSPNWPGEFVITAMVSHAAGNFMWATATADFIGSGHPHARLDTVMSQAPASMWLLYSLYSAILNTSFGKFAQNSSEAQALRAVLGVMIFSRRPLRVVEYTKLPTPVSVDSAMVEMILIGLSSVMDKGPTLQFIHKSFDDFLVSEECPAKYAINPAEAQHLLTRLCLATMTTELSFNICSLETSCLKNMDVPNINAKVAYSISALLSYSCCYWADHLSHTSFNKQLLQEVKDMVFDKLLYWFEAMSLLNEITRVSYSLLSVLNWVKPASDEELDDFIRDAYQFIRAFGYPISQSAPHIYISALPFAPECSHVVKKFLSRFPRILEISGGKPADWLPCVFTSEHHTSFVHSVAFSPDEKYFVSGSYSSTCICDSETGNLIAGPLGDSHSVRSSESFFDLDGQNVWARYNDGQVISWDVTSGDKHLDFRAGGQGDVIGCCCTNGSRNIVSVSKTGAVILWNADTGEKLRDVLTIPSRDDAMVSFSRDGSYMAWAGARDMNIRIWKLRERKEIHVSQPHSSHAKSISALSFSADGVFAVSGSEGGTIVIQDVETGDIFGRPLVTDKGKVDAVAYSHESDNLVSASGDPGTVMVWNASTHEAVLGPLEGHTSSITAIALSRDGQRALTAADDGTVRMWDLGNKSVVPVIGAIESRTSQVYVAFSPCGQKFASLAYPTIRVWDVSTGEPLLSPIKVTSQCEKFMFSPDGRKIVAFGLQFIWAWNANTGELAFTHTLGFIKHVAFRSTDQRLVTCLLGGGVSTWRLEDNSLIEDLPASHIQSENPAEPVRIIALSPDGSTLFVRDKFRSPRYYLWSTTTHQSLPLTFIDDAYISRGVAAYSPSGRFFAAASKEGVLRVWNTQTGQLVASPSMLKGPLTYLAFSPDDRHLAFSYYSYNDNDTAIWIWNAQTASLVSGPWKSHIDHVVTLAFSPDGGKLVSASRGGQFGIWNTADLLGPLRASPAGLEITGRMQDGWLTNTSGKMLFWASKDHRSRLVWSENIATVCGRGGSIQLDVSKLRYGEDWADCFVGGM